MSRETLEQLLRQESLSAELAYRTMHSILRGECEAAWLGAFLVALRSKGETPDEISGFARAMREQVTPIPCESADLIDTCGTGGDGAQTFNISTASAFVVAAAGQPVAKHGNRAVSSHCGSADVLEILGARLDLSPVQVGRCVDEVGIGFLFAPALHGAMKHAAPVRKALGIRTVFNLLGPLTNPAGAPFQVLGVFSEDLLDPMAEVLRALGSRSALVVHGRDGLDELSVCAINDARYLDPAGKIVSMEIDPASLVCGPYPAEALQGGDAARNAEILRQVLEGATGAAADVVRINAGAALWVAGRSPSLASGVELATETLRRGDAATVLDRFVAWTQAARG